jgi:predicted dehydrogenase
VADFELVAVVDPLPEARRQAQSECSAQVLADYHDLFGRIDAAVVATPTSLHRGVSCELLEHGIHLLVEKPLASTLAEADEILSAARRHDAIVQVGHIERFNPAWNRAEVLPMVREPKYIEATRASGYTFRSTDIGVVLDMMIHDLDLALSFANSPVRRVQAIGISVLGDHEDVATARLEFASGCVANLSASRVSYKPQRHMQVWSDRGCVTLDFAARTAATVRPVTELLQREFDLDDIDAQGRAHLKEHLFEDLLPLEQFEAVEKNALLEELNDFAGSIRDHRQPIVTGQQGRDVLAVADQILQSIEEHRWDGDAAGRVGPLALPAAAILRGPHWSKTTDQRQRRREAG